MPRKRTKPPSTRSTLLDRLRASGDTEAWKTFVDLYMPLVYRFRRSRNFQDYDSRDVTQQVLAIVHQTIDKFEYDRERGKFLFFFKQKTAYEILRHQRKDRRPGKGAGDGRGTDIASLSSAAVDPQWAEEF